MKYSKTRIVLGLSLSLSLLLLPGHSFGMHVLGVEELVQANGADLQVPGYSVPIFTDWNNDNLPDLVVGQGGGEVTPAKVAVFLNSGSLSNPVFTTSFFAQSDGSDLSLPASGCLGLFPRVVNWDDDSRKDLLIGTAQGNIMVFLNIGTDEMPVFDAGSVLSTQGQIPEVIDVGARATPMQYDWDQDGRPDLISGAFDGFIHIFLNIGTNSEPLFAPEILVQDLSGDLVVPDGRSSPAICDFNADGIKDLMAGNTLGQLVFYANEGSNSSPVFSEPMLVMCDRVPIDLPGSARSRPSACDWTGDGLLDFLIGSDDGKVHLFQSEGISPAEQIPLASSVLRKPWPNPFNPQVNIEFNLGEPTIIQVGVYDLAGREVTQLARGEFPMGISRLNWQGNDDAGRTMPSGVYFVRFRSEAAQSMQKIMLVR